MVAVTKEFTDRIFIDKLNDFSNTEQADIGKAVPITLCIKNQSKHNK